MDERTYIRLHDGMPDHPKVVGLSHAAFRLYVESLCWCGRHLTDGVVPAAAMRRMGGWSAGTVKELARAGLIESGNDPDWLIHDYTQHQRTAGEVAGIREAKRLAGVTGNHERWHLARGLRDPECELCAIDDASLDESHVRSHMQSHIESSDDREPGRKHTRKTSPETETESETQSERTRTKTIDQCGSDDDPDFTEFWSIYPRKVGKGQARKAWRAAVRGRRADPQSIVARAKQFCDRCAVERTETKYIPHPATWLNGERYDDSDSPAVASTRFSYPASPYGN